MGTSKGHRGLYTKRGGGKGHPTHTQESGLGESKSANTWIPDFQLTQFEKISCALFKLVFCCGLGNGIDGADWAAWKSVFGARTRTSMAIRQMPAWVKAMQSRHGWLKQENRLWKHHYSSRSTGKVAMVSQTAEDSKQRGVCLQAAFWVQAADPFLISVHPSWFLLPHTTHLTHLVTGNAVWHRKYEGIAVLSSHFGLFINLKSCLYSKPISNFLKDSYFAFKIAI